MCSTVSKSVSGYSTRPSAFGYRTTPSFRSREPEQARSNNKQPMLNPLPIRFPAIYVHERPPPATHVSLTPKCVADPPRFSRAICSPLYSIARDFPLRAFVIAASLDPPSSAICEGRSWRPASASRHAWSGWSPAVQRMHTQLVAALPTAPRCWDRTPAALSCADAHVGLTAIGSSSPLVAGCFQLTGHSGPHCRVRRTLRGGVSAQ